MINTRKVALFVGLTFVVSWLLAGLFFAFGGEWKTPPAFAVAIAYMFVPMTVVVIVQKVVYKEPVGKPLGVSFRPSPWWLRVAWFLPPVMALATLGVGLLLPGVEYSPGMEGMYERFEPVMAPEEMEVMRIFAERLPIHMLWFSLLQGLVAGITVNAVAGFGEELGWRGLMQKELAPLGFWRSSLLIGLVWGVWHAPLILQGHNYPEHPVAGVFMMIVFCLLWAPLFSYVRTKSRSVIAAAVMHGSLNGTAGLSILVLKGGSDLTVGFTGLAGLIVLVLANAGLILYDRFLAGEPIMVGKNVQVA